MFRKFLTTALLVSLACSDGMAACGSEVAATVADPAPAATTAGTVAAAPAAAPAAPVAAAGALTGKIGFEGTPPERGTVDTRADAVCHDMHKENPLGTPSAVLVDAGGGLKDVFVQLTGLPEAKHETPAEPVILDQVGCEYVPHVFGVMRRQEIKIKNSDPTLHNVHAQPKVNKEFNIAMPNIGERVQDFRRAEDAIKIKCDVHPWMVTWCFVLEHPYYAVSGADGSFSINLAGLADGEYGVKIWHELLGEKEAKVTVKDGAGSFEHTYKS